VKFHRAVWANDEPEVRKWYRQAGVPDEQADAEIARMRTQELYLSDTGTYQVALDRSVRNGFDLPMIHLSIKRVDRGVIRDWRVFQEIKNALVGPECEAIELYPAESRLVDSANQYHLWCFADPSIRVPVGYTERLVDDKPFGKSINRPFSGTKEQS
jgi:hypothetical protein